MKFFVLLTLGILSLSKAEESYVLTEFLMGYDQFSAALYKVSFILFRYKLSFILLF